MEDYEIGRTLAEGRFGQVSEGRRVSDGLRVAVKRVRARRLIPGIPYDPWSRSAEREIQVLSVVRHPNVVCLLHHAKGEDAGTTLLVYHYMAWDLCTLLEHGAAQEEGHVKAITQMLLCGVAHLHNMRVMHRDLKPANLLVEGTTGVLKIADFGSSRLFSIGEPGFFDGEREDSATAMGVMAGSLAEEEGMTRDVCTRWYKSPEMLFGSIDYTSTVDLWASGCVLGELLTAGRQPLFPGGTDIDQLCCIFRNLGTPHCEEWPEVEKLPDYGKIEFLPVDPQPFDFEGSWSQEVVDLLYSLLRLNPALRALAADALKAAAFFAGPPVAEPRTLVAGLEEPTTRLPPGSGSDGGLRGECDGAGSEGSLWGLDLNGEGFERINFDDVETTQCGLWAGATGVPGDLDGHEKSLEGSPRGDDSGSGTPPLPPLLQERADGQGSNATAAPQARSGHHTPPPPVGGAPWRLKGT